MSDDTRLTRRELTHLAAKIARLGSGRWQWIDDWMALDGGELWWWKRLLLTASEGILPGDDRPCDCAFCRHGQELGIVTPFSPADELRAASAPTEEQSS